MKAFEEKFTAWMDGQLAGRELEEFERELQRREGGLAAAEKERTVFKSLSAALKRHASAPELEFPEVFNQQILDRMESVRERRTVPWRLRWLVWAGVGCLAVAAGLYQTLIPKPHPVQGSYWAEVKSVRVADPSLWAEPVSTSGEEVTLIWIDGLDYLPESYALR